MQPIERYGLVALLFVFVTVVGVVSWDFSDAESDGTVQAAESGKKTPSSPRAREPEPDPEAARMALKTRSRAIQRASLTIDEPGTLREERPEPAGISPAPGAGGDRKRSGRPVELRRDTEAGLVAMGGDASRPKSAPPRSSAIEPAVDLRPGTPQQGARRADRANSGRPTGTPGVYVVKSGDTLGEIALSQLGTSKRWKEIVGANPGLDPGKLRVGARLKLPSRAAPEATNTTARNNPAQNNPTRSDALRPRSSAEAGATVRVRSGDSLWKIAARALGDGERWKEIAALNPRINPDRLAVGQEIVLPRGAQAARIADSSAPSGNASRTGSSASNRRVVR